MKNIFQKIDTLLLTSLSLMWLQGAIASMLPSGYKTGVLLLQQYDFINHFNLIHYVIWGGIIADTFMAIFSLWVIFKTSYRFIYALSAILLISSYTLLATYLAPHLWLDPFGCLAKNFPILVLHILIYFNSNSYIYHKN